MKLITLIFFIPLFGSYQKKMVKYEKCTFLTGVYILNTTEKWRLRATRDSPDDYFIFQCDENDCDRDVDQVTFRYFDCDGNDDNGVVVLCPADGSREKELTFTNCESDICNKIEGGHFTKVEFHRRGKPTWTGKYSCENN